MSEETVRLDRWLWAARMFRSRSLAAEACDGGKVAVNGHTAKPHKLVRPGDGVEIHGTHPRVPRVRALGKRRGPAPAARELYDELTPPKPRIEREQSPAVRDHGSGRPTKRDRRQLDRLRGS